jgi:hypothetical protein
MAAGLAQAQESRAAWTRPDLVHCIAQHLPDYAIGWDREPAWQLLEELTAQAPTGEAGEEVCWLGALEWPHVPDTLRGADGESIYRVHRGERYATRAQLPVEEQLFAGAIRGAPYLARDRSAALRGADFGQVQMQLHAGAAGG